MTLTLVDSDVVLDSLTANHEWSEWSDQWLSSLWLQQAAVTNQIVFAEVSVYLDSYDATAAVLSPSRFRWAGLPWAAAFEAGKAYLLYRRHGGLRRSPMPDFYIGAHAMVEGLTLLTRDATRYRTYFPDLDIVAPDTHPDPPR